jgi:hypothetical protein
MSLAAGDGVWKSAYLGSVTAGCQLGRVGNFPITAEEVATELSI